MVDHRSFRRKLFVFLFVIFGFITITSMIKLSSPIETEINNDDSTLSSTSCIHVTVDELDQWYHSKQWNEIPKIIHQTWKNKTLRERQKQWSQTWCEQYTGWRYHLWTDDENDVFVRTKYPWFYPIYKRLHPPILRADSVRYLYMLYYGGLYIDLDYESIRRVDELIANKHVVFSLINYSFDSGNSIPNSWMVSRPNHPLWTYILYRIMVLWSSALDKQRREHAGIGPEYYTGPEALFDGLMLYLHLKQHTDQSLNQLLGDKERQTSDAILEVADITFFGLKLINAYDWMNNTSTHVCSAERPTFDANKCKDIIKPIYSITYWSHTYGYGRENDPTYLAK